MRLRDVLPRFYADAIAAIAAMPNDAFSARVSRDDLLAQFEHLEFVEPCRVGDRCGSFHVTSPTRHAQQGYAFSIDFDVPSGNVLAHLDLDLQITGFEPISTPAQRDIQDQLDALSSV